MEQKNIGRQAVPRSNPAVLPMAMLLVMLKVLLMLFIVPRCKQSHMAITCDLSGCNADIVNL